MGERRSEKRAYRRRRQSVPLLLVFTFLRFFYELRNCRGAVLNRFLYIWPFTRSPRRLRQTTTTTKRKNTKIAKSRFVAMYRIERCQVRRTRNGACVSCKTFHNSAPLIALAAVCLCFSSSYFRSLSVVGFWGFSHRLRHKNYRRH